MSAKITGMKALNAKMKTMRGASDEAMQLGLNMGGLFLQRESQKIVPIDTGNLVRSADTRPDPEGGKPSAIVGYSANYAVFVHEDLEARHMPGKQAKFLEQPFREKRKRIVEVVGETVKRVMGW